jgi:hypothetical protein
VPAAKEAPGLRIRKRGNGDEVAYWIAPVAAVRLGFPVKTVRLIGDESAIVARCRVLQTEANEWLAGRRTNPRNYDGTFASLVRFYETHPDSPYRELRQVTQRNYSKVMALLMANKGKRRVDKVTAVDIKRWYNEIVATGRKPGWAYLTINILKAVLAFGSTMRLAECRLLRQELADMRFRAGKRRKARLSYEQTVTLRDKAHELGLHWMALLLAVMFDAALRRRDVIGEWITDETAEAAIRHGKRIWRDGLVWSDIAGGTLRRLCSKTALTSEVEVVVKIADYPDLQAELARVPIERRIGPVIVHHRTGLPPNEIQCRTAFRVVARAAGIPDEIWNTDTRPGAIRAAYEPALSA